MKPMTLGEKLIWASTFVDFFNNPQIGFNNRLSFALEESCYVIEHIRDNINDMKTKLGEDSNPYQMLKEMLKD